MPRAGRSLAARPGVAALVLLNCLKVALGDSGYIDWGALTQGNSSSAGNTLYTGDGTFYGQQSGQDDMGACSYGKGVSDTLKLDWSNGVAATVAMNDCQFQESLACGLCLYFRGTGSGIGTTPLSRDWQFGFVDNRCPECAKGSLDLDQNGDGRWGVEWFPAPCNVGSGKFKYVMSGDTSNEYWFQFTVSNTRVPVEKVEMKCDGNWNELRRTFNNMYAANGGPFKTWPLPVRVTSVLGDTVEDQIPSKWGGQGSAQFPDRGGAVFPNSQAPAQSPSKPGQTLGPQPQAPQPPSETATVVTSSPAVASSPPPEAPENVPSVPTGPVAPFSILNYGQCGGNSAFCSQMPGQCKDAVWDYGSCLDGFTCQRCNASWWECQPEPQPLQRGRAVELVPEDLSDLVSPVDRIDVALENPDAQAFVAALVAEQEYTVSAGAQCGGLGYFCQDLIPATCIDAPWEKSQCCAGYACTRDNASWWGCQPGTPSPLPPSSVAVAEELVSAFAGPLETSAGTFQVVAGGQCGGSGGSCTQLESAQCKDAVWNGAQCADSYRCSRWNAGWWQCMPAFFSSGRRMLAQ